LGRGIEMVEIDDSLKKELTQLITNSKDSLPVYKIKNLSRNSQVEKASQLASKFVSGYCYSDFPDTVVYDKSENTTTVDLPERTKIRIYNNSNAMIIRKITGPLDNIFPREIDMGQLKERTIGVMKRFEFDNWCSEIEQLEFEHLWKIKASAITLREKIKIPQVLCSVVGAFRRYINRMPVYGRASVFVKLAANDVVQSAGIDWRIIEKEPVDEIKIIEPEEAAELMLRNIGGTLPNQKITSKIFKPEFFGLGYFSLPRTRYQTFMQPAYVSIFSPTGMMTAGQAVVTSASRDIYENLGRIAAPPVKFETFRK
jgi:hypothetical protein